MLDTTLIFSATNSKGYISIKPRPIPRRLPNDSGFTLLELIVAMSIVSMLVLVLYYAFSIGVQTWSRGQDASSDVLRAEAAIRLLEEDLDRIVPYDMHWEKGQIQLFAGGPHSLFYVTENGHGASSRSGSSLFFTMLYLEDCEQGQAQCLYLNKVPVPSQGFIQEVDRFRAMGEMQREHFLPREEAVQDRILVWGGLNQALFSYSANEYTPFAGREKEAPEDFERRQDERLQETHWLQEELPRQVKFSFERQDRKYIVHASLDNNLE